MLSFHGHHARGTKITVSPPVVAAILGAVHAASDWAVTGLGTEGSLWPTALPGSLEILAATHPTALVAQNLPSTQFVSLATLQGPRSAVDMWVSPPKLLPSDAWSTVFCQPGSGSR